MLMTLKAPFNHWKQTTFYLTTIRECGGSFSPSSPGCESQLSQNYSNRNDRVNMCLLPNFEILALLRDRYCLIWLHWLLVWQQSLPRQIGTSITKNLLESCLRGGILSHKINPTYETTIVNYDVRHHSNWKFAYSTVNYNHSVFTRLSPDFHFLIGWTILIFHEKHQPNLSVFFVIMEASTKRSSLPTTSF